MRLPVGTIVHRAEMCYHDKKQKLEGVERMRRLWIHRRKSPAARMTKMKVYIEDPEGDALINGFLCRQLGELKNGQMRSFSIGSGALRVFVVADAFSRNLYNEFALIPEGEEDVVLSGRNVRKSGSGNPFRFDGPADEGMPRIQQQGSGGKTVLMVLAIIAAIVVGVAAGLGAAVVRASNSQSAGEPETFAAAQLRITLPNSFEEVDMPGYTACFSEGETAVFVLREEPDPAVYGELSLDVYGAMILANSGLGQTVQLQKEGGLTTFETSLTASDSGQAYSYYCGLFRGADAYWMVQITTVDQNPRERIPQFRQWLMSVSFTE